MLRSLLSRLEQTALRRGYRLTWAPQVTSDRPETCLDFDLEFVLAHLMLAKQDIFFIQIGANDGISSDPLYPFITRYGWSGILVEPMPAAFASLKATHGTNPRLTLLNAAVSHSDGRRPIYTVRIDGDTFSGADMYSSFDRDVVLSNGKFVPDIAERIVKTEVDAISMGTMLRYANGRKADVLMIDTEGFDFEILKMLDFSRLSPALICYEHSHLSRPDMQAAATLLAGHGYRMTRDNSDTIAYRPDLRLGWKGASRPAEKRSAI